MPFGVVSEVDQRNRVTRWRHLANTVERLYMPAMNRHSFSETYKKLTGRGC